MCINIFRDPGKAFSLAAKEKKLQKSFLVLLESSAILAVAATIISNAYFGLINIVFGLNAFVVLLAIGIVVSYIINLILKTLGGKGEFYEGLTVISYSFLPVTSGILLASILSLIPTLGFMLGMISLTVMFAFGLAVLYRGIKEMFKTDMITSFITVSILTVSFILGLYASFGMSIMSKIIYMSAL